MKTYCECIPCFIRHTVSILQMVTDDSAAHEKILKQVLAFASRMDMNDPPPAMAQKLHKIINKEIDIEDPYKRAKKKFNDFALEVFPVYQQAVESSGDPFETAVRLAIEGNIIDLGVNFSLGVSEASEVIEKTLTDTFDTKFLDQFRDDARDAENILFLADNAGEIVFDKFLIEQIGPEKITVAVKGSAALNDATIEDAEYTGLTGLVEVIDNGDNAPGTILKSCSKEFLQRFEQADLVIAKGQGNFETLSDTDKSIYFILRAKCPVVAEHLNCSVGTLVLSKKIP